jgi:hypothetical protein
VNNDTVVHHVGGRAALDVNLDCSRASQFKEALWRDDHVVVILPILLVLPPNRRCAAQELVAGAFELDVLGNQREKSVKIAVVVAIDVLARELVRINHASSFPASSSRVCLVESVSMAPDPGELEHTS